MRKSLHRIILLAILLAILAGAFLPETYISAESLGNCTVDSSTSSQVIPNKTPSECSALKVKTTWTANPSGAATLVGSCLVDSGTSSKVLQNKTIIECNALKVSTTWTPVQTTTPGPNSNPAGGNTSTSTYNLLAPLPGSNGQLVKTVDASGSNALADYLNTIIRLTIGLAAVLAVLMIIMGGLEYITSELPGAKGEGKQKITNAVVGLLVALGAWVILYTINPKLVETDLSNLQTTTIQYIDGPDAGDDTVDPDFQKKELTYSTTTTTSPGVASAVLKLKQGWQISQFHIFSNKRMLIQLTNGSQTDNSNIIDIGIGLNGFAKAGTAKTSDKKTPSGGWKIIDIRHVPGKAQFNKKGSNMGAAFWHLDPMTSGERGIGMHGNKNGTISSTNGCIRLKNTDLLALQPYIKTGIPVYID